MKLFMGADHRGFKLKETIKTWLLGQGHQVVDCGNTVYDKDDDYPDFALAVAAAVAQDLQGEALDGAHKTNPHSLGIVICGSGGGVTMAANKVHGIRCAQGVAISDVEHNRDHNDMNVLAVGSDGLSEDQVRKLIEAFVTTPFTGAERCKRRIQKIADAERSQK